MQQILDEFKCPACGCIIEGYKKVPEPKEAPRKRMVSEFIEKRLKREKDNPNQHLVKELNKPVINARHAARRRGTRQKQLSDKEIDDLLDDYLNW